MKKTLSIEDSTARKLYKTADQEFRVLLEENFGREFFLEKVTDRIKTFQDAMDANVDRPNYLYLQPFVNPINKLQRKLNAEAKLDVISYALNEGWVPDFNNSNQPKYYVYFKKTLAGWSVDFIDCYDASVGSGFYFKSSELALYFGNQFLTIHQDWLPD